MNEPASEQTPPAPGSEAGAASAADVVEGGAKADAGEAQSGAGLVAGGIFASRVLGLVREQVISFFLGVGPHADVIQTAFKTPNLLQNLLGEGTISASFIPVYCRMLAEDREAAGRFAGAIFGLLVMAAGGLSLLGVLLAEPIVAVLAPGFLDDAAKVAAGELAVNRYELSVLAVRIIFPMTALLSLSAWALGVLNSHRRFFLPYVAPVLWNVAIIGGLVAGALLFLPEPFGFETRAALPTDGLSRLVIAACIGGLVGGLLQLLVQLPTVREVLRGFRLSFSTKVEGVKEALRAFGPVVAGRGVAQVAAYLDLFLGSLLAAGALSSLRYAQILYMLPISLFGMSVAAAELPELSRLTRDQLDGFQRRMTRSARQVLFLTIPTVVGYLVLGFYVVALIFQRGSFGLNDTWLVYLVLAAYTLGLGATALSRLLQNAFYAVGDTKTPAVIAVGRVILSAAVAVPLMFYLDRFVVSDVLGFDAAAAPLRFGAIGLAVGASVAAWGELVVLGIYLKRKLPGFELPTGRAFRIVGLSLLAVLPALGLVWILAEQLPSWGVALLVLPVYAGLYLVAAYLLGFPEVRAWLGRFTRHV